MNTPITSWKDVEARGFIPSHNRQPDTGDRLLEILWRHGGICKDRLRADQINWKLKGHDFSAVGYR